MVIVIRTRSSIFKNVEPNPTKHKHLLAHQEQTFVFYKTLTNDSNVHVSGKTDTFEIR